MTWRQLKDKRTRSKRISIRIEGAREVFEQIRFCHLFLMGILLGILLGFLFYSCYVYDDLQTHQKKLNRQVKMEKIPIRSVVKSWNSLWKKILWKLGPLRARGGLSKEENWRIHDKFSTVMARLVIKFSFSKKAIKIWRNLPLDLTFT